MSNDDLSAFRAEMNRRGVYSRPSTPGRKRIRRRAREPIDITRYTLKQLAGSLSSAQADSEWESIVYRALVEKVKAILEARR